MPEPLKLTIRADDIPPEELSRLTSELDAWIRQTAPGVRTTRPEARPPRPGEKGAPVEIGTLLLALINAGAATALINCLATYIKERRRSVKIEVKDANGQALSLSAENVAGDQIQQLVRELSSFSGQAKPASG